MEMSLIIPLFVSIAYLTLAERKQMGSMQRRKGPNKIGVQGVIQPLADGLKLAIKETIIVSQGNKRIFMIAPYICLVLGLLAWGVIPWSRGIIIEEIGYSTIYILLITGIGVLGIILAGWSGNSKYAALGSIRTTAQLISYEVVIGLMVIMVVILSDGLNIIKIIEVQKEIWNIIGVWPIKIIFMISAIAETNRPPMDLPEAESELVAGYQTEHSALSFAYFFLGEYANVILICVMMANIYWGGYSLGSINSGLILGVKVSILLILFIICRATLPRLRFDQLMTLMWMGLLPIVLGYFILLSSIIVVLVN